jgi:raffinose/stachyose/melibiose transport system permease protein
MTILKDAGSVHLQTSASTARSRRRTVRPRDAARAIGLYAFLAFAALVVLIPMLSILSVALQPAGTPVSGLQWPTNPQWINFVRAWNTGQFSGLMVNSAIIAICVVPLGIVVSVLAGYAFGTMRFRGSNLLFYIFMIGLVMPFESTVVPLYYDLRSMNLINSYWGVILPEVALYCAFGIFWMRSFFKSMPPALLDAARIDGATSWRVLTDVLLPLARPAILTLSTLFFIWSWNEFLIAIVVLNSPDVQTAPAGLGLFVGQRLSDIPGLSAGAIIISIPILILYVVLNRKIISGLLQGAVKE